MEWQRYSVTTLSSAILRSSHAHITRRWIQVSGFSGPASIEASWNIEAVDFGGDFVKDLRVTQ